jgi:glycine/D-amino acid oxidase-like deaminating enzyme
MRISFWEREQYLKNIDVFIIGSGLVGLSAGIALKKKKPGLKVTVLEKSWLSAGASSKNAGFACFGSLGELVDDLKSMDEKTVRETLLLRWEGLKNLRSWLGDKAISYEENGSLELFSSEEEDHFQDCLKNMDSIESWVSDITGSSTYKLSSQKIRKHNFSGFNHAIENVLEGQIDTGKMLTALVNKAKNLGVQILNGIEVFAFEEGAQNVTLNSNIGELSAHKLIVANNGFASQVLREVDVKPARAQVLITKEIPNLNWKGTFHFDKGYYYFRNVGKRILLGGGRNLDYEAETTSEIATSEKIQKELIRLLDEKIAPGLNPEIDMQWAGIMGVGETKKPIIKAIGTQSVCAVRMGGMGIAIGSKIGVKAADLLLGESPDAS